MCEIKKKSCDYNLVDTISDDIIQAQFHMYIIIVFFFNPSNVSKKNTSV